MNNEYVVVKAQDLKDLVGFIANLYDCIDFDSKEVKEHGVENGWNDFVQPILDVARGEGDPHGKYILAKDVDIEIFKENLENVYDYDITGLTDNQITELYNDVQDRLGNDDTYNELYNDAVRSVMDKAIEHPSLDSQIVDAQQQVAQSPSVEGNDLNMHQWEQNL